MSIWGKIAGGVAGLAIGGPIGGLLGAVAGHYAVDRSQKGADGVDQIAFTIGVIALSAKMAKADGHVDDSEVAAFREIVEIPPDQEKFVARVFNMARQHVAGYESYAKQIAGMFLDRPDVLEGLLNGLFHIAKADGVVRDEELDYLAHVAQIFGFDEARFERIRAAHIEGPAADPYKVLGVPHNASNEEIKSTYRKLVRENHPDRMIARGVPEEFVAIATEKLAAINEAYSQIAMERKL